MAFDYVPAASNASGDAYPGRTMSDDASFTSYDSKVCSAKYRGQEWDNEILALIAKQVSGSSYTKQWTCGTGDAVGDPVRISANDTVTKALATTEANSKIIGVIRHKGALGAASVPAATTCYLAHFYLVTGLSGGTAGNPVYLSDAGSYAASAGTFSRVVGRWVNTTTALVDVSPGNVLIGTGATDTISATDSRLTNARTPVGTSLTAGYVWYGDGSNQAAAGNIHNNANLTTNKIWYGVGGKAVESDLPASDLTNLCLNPGFETILPGTHTTRIQDQGITLRLPSVGWFLESPSGTYTPDFKAEQDTTTYTGASDASIKVTATDFDSTTCMLLYQLWNSTEYLEKHVYQCRGKYLAFAADVKLSSAIADACCLYITTDGTGGVTTWSSYHGNNTNWERLFVSVQVPADATEISFGLEMNYDSTNYYVDNAMVAATDTAQTSLPYLPSRCDAMDGELVRISAAQLLNQSSCETPPEGHIALYSKTDKKLYFKNEDGSERECVVADSGNVGLGTTPTSKLHVVNTTAWDSTNPLATLSNVETGTTHGNGLLVQGGADSSSSYELCCKDLSGNIDFYVRGDGNVGVNRSANLQAKNEVSIDYSKTSTSTGSVLALTSNDSSNQAGLLFQLIGGASQSVRRAAIGTIEHGVAWGGSITLQENGGTVGIGTASPSCALDVNGNIYCSGDVSALTFTDRTPHYDGDALSELAKIKGHNGEIDHSTLPEFARVTRKTKDAKGTEQIEDGRNLGAMISMLTVAVQQLQKKIEVLENKTK